MAAGRTGELWTQERIVLGLAVLLFVFSSIALPGFLAANNLIAIVRSVSVLGILAVGMAIVMIGRGIDLSAVAIMAMSTAWYLQMLNDGWSPGAAFAVTVAGVLVIGLVNGFLIAYADVPAIFATLASGAFVFGYVRSQLIGQDAVPVPRGNWLEAIGRARFLDVPVGGLHFRRLRLRGLPLPALHEMGPLRLSHGRQLLGGTQHGHPGTPDDHAALRHFGADRARRRAPDGARACSASTRASSTRRSLYDIILVVVIGGIGLSGGKGGIRNVIVGAMLIGIMLNAMTIIDIPNIYQNLIKSTILLLAIVDRQPLNPRDEQTAQQGDI